MLMDRYPMHYTEAVGAVWVGGAWGVMEFTERFGGGSDEA